MTDKKNIDKELKQIREILENIGYKVQRFNFEETLDSFDQVSKDPQMNDIIRYELTIEGFRFKGEDI